MTSQEKANIDISGFTLIEVLIAIAVFSIGFLAVGSMQISSTSNNLSARMQTEATILGTRQMEDLMIASYSALELTAGPHSRSAFIAPTGIYNTYTVEWNVTVNQPLPSTKTVNVTVCWEKHANAPANCNPAPRKRSVSLAFVRADL